MDWMFRVFPYLFGIMFVTIFILFASILLSHLGRKKKDDRSPRLTVPAQVISRRTEFRRNAGHDMPGFTYYYATFQVESGDRMEFSLTGPEYGMLLEGDSGKLSFQGPRYLGFERQ